MTKTLCSGATASKYQTITRTAEFVSPGHPDKMCDIMSDYILDLYLAKDPKSRVAVEVMGGHGELIICGEVTSAARIDIEKCFVQKLAISIIFILVLFNKVQKSHAELMMVVQAIKELWLAMLVLKMNYYCRWNMF